MTGRRAVAASTNDEAVKPPPKSMYGYVHEDYILRPVSSTIHPDNWPCFVLNGASVVGKDLKTLVSLLHAELEGPLTIRGLLEVDREFLHLRKDGKTRQKTMIEVTEVRGYSIGIGPVTIWAHGKAGWFEIRPAPMYERIYRKMAEGVKLYYFLTDIYESRKKQALSLDEVFQRYVEEIEPSMELDQVKERREEHAKFLFSQMRKVDEPTRWSRTSFYRWLMERCPHIHVLYQKKPKANEALFPLVVSTSSDKGIHPKHKRTPTLPETAKLKRPKILESWTELIIHTMNELHQSGKVPCQQMNIRRLSRSLYERYDIASESLAQEFVKVYAKSLITAFEEPDWATSPIYLELELILSQPENRKGPLWNDAKNLELKPRFVSGEVQVTDSSPEVVAIPSMYGRGRKRSSPSEQEDSLSSPEEDVAIQITNHGHAREFRPRGRPINYSLKPRQTTLPSRPKSSKAKLAATLAETTRKMATQWNLSDEENESSTAPVGRSLRPRGPSRSGKVAALRLVSSPATKDQSALLSSDDDDQDGPSIKRSKVSHSPNDDDSEITGSSNDFTPTMGPGDLGDEEPEEVREVLTFVSEPIPKTSPQGPNGLWSCTQGGCDYQVAAADKPDGRAKVHKHFLKHADEISARENLVLEERRPYLQVSHLLEKLRSLGEAARLNEEKKIGGHVVPQPIKRRLVF